MYLIIGPVIWTIFGPTTSIGIAFIAGLAPATLLIPLWREIDFKQVKEILIFSLPGILIGILAHLYLDKEVLYFLAGSTIISLIVLVRLEKRITAKLAGLSSGALTTAVGFNGPPLSLSFKGRDEKIQRSSVITCLLFLSVFATPIFITVKTEEFVPGLIDGALFCPLVFVGVLLGNSLAHKIGNKIEIIALVVSLSGAIFLITKSIF